MKKWLAAVPSTPWVIFAVTAVHMAIGLGAALAWLLTGHASIITAFLHYPGAIFLVSVSAAELWLSWFCWRQFSRGDVLRQGWCLIMLASAAHLIGNVFFQLLGVNSFLNPLMYFGVPWANTAMESLRRIGLLVGGPFHMTLLACGLSFVLGIYGRSGLLPRLARANWLLAAVLLAYTVREASQLDALLRSGKVAARYEVFGWPTDALLIVLLFEAVCIFRSVLGMGWGLIAKCWAAFSVAIAATVLGDIGLWANWNGYLPGWATTLGWYTSFLAGAAYVLGPAYQMEAFRRVRQSGLHIARQTAARRTAA
jgi:hypothetical protein